MASVEDACKLLEQLAPLLQALRKYEPNFSPDARALLQKSITSNEGALGSAKELGSGQSQSRVAAYLLQGAKVAAFKACLSSVLTNVTSIHSGSMPLPRSSKEELGNLRTSLASIKLDAPAEQVQLAAKLTKLYGDALAKRTDVDAVEVQVDDMMRSVLQHVFGVPKLETEAAQKELQALEDAVNAAQGNEHDSTVLNLALNSLQRLHFDKIKMEESEEEEEEEEEPVGAADNMEDDDEDDPFFMPVPTAAIKMADERKFRMLAEPLGPADESGAAKPMLELDAEDSGSIPTTPSASKAARQADQVPETPGLTAADFEPVPMADLQASQVASDRMSADGGAAAAAALQGMALAGSFRAAAAEPAAPAPTDASAPASGPPALTVPGAGAGEEARGMSEEDGEVGTPGPASPGAVAGPVSPSTLATADGAAAPAQNEDKLKQFVTFLQGENPGACMFHAQMRLSLDGCRKLANFLSGSQRVRALSLSHNYLGDDGMKIICEGLIQNRSVTAMDLPDNNISDAGCVALANAIKNNPSLTQLQLAYNHIGDEGAAALAELIKCSQSLKKLGLSYNKIGKKGCQALTTAISGNQSLKHLQLLPGNPVEEKDAKALAKALKRNKKFSIRSLLGMN